MDGSAPLRVLIADDSGVSRRLLKEVLARTPNVEVVGEATNGAEAVALARRLRPDVVLMDVAMPIMDGAAATRVLVTELGIPVVAITSLDPAEESERLTQAGARAVLSKTALLQGEGEVIIRTLRKAAQSAPRRLAPQRPRSEPAVPFPVIAVAASTSGPPALRTLLAALPADLGAAVVVAQHLHHGFGAGLAQWLQTQVTLAVRVARNGMSLEPNTVYLAPDGHHLIVQGTTLATPVASADDPWRPSADRLFRSVAAACGPLAIGVVLTGMGHDGAAGAEAIRAAGGHVIVQDPEDASVTGMPRAVIERQAYDIVLPLAAMGPYLVTLVRRLQARTHARS